MCMIEKGVKESVDETLKKRPKEPQGKRTRPGEESSREYQIQLREDFLQPLGEKKGSLPTQPARRGAPPLSDAMGTSEGPVVRIGTCK